MIFEGTRTEHGATVTLDGKPFELPEINPKHEARHSPTGFEWNYAGSGPAELARAVLISVFPEQKGVRHPAVYQQFKFDIIAPLPRQGFILTDEEVSLWLDWFKRRHEREWGWAKSWVTDWLEPLPDAAEA